MDLKLNLFLISFIVLSASVASITVSSNGNSPAVKMEGGMIGEKMKAQESATMIPLIAVVPTKSNYEKSRQLHPNATTLALNERYRRLIPYMTFYYANDLVAPTSNTKVEVEKAEIIEADERDRPVLRQPKKIAHYSQSNIPRYQGNRLTQYNIASANPTKVFYKDGVPIHHPGKITQNPNLYDYVNNNYDTGRIVQKYITKPFLTHPVPQRKPYVNLYKNEESPNIRYYLSEKEPETKYKLVPYEQTPPVVVPQQSENLHEVKKPYHVTMPVNKEQIFIKHRPVRPDSLYHHNINQQPPTRKQPVLISGNQYRKQRPQSAVPIVESGFTPIVNIPHNPGAPIYTPDLAVKFEAIHGTKKPVELIQTTVEAPEPEYEQKYYVVDRPVYNPIHTQSNSLTSLIKSLQLNRSIPKAITKDNVGSSIRTLLQALNAIKATPIPLDADGPALSTPSPFVTPATVLEINNSPVEPDPVTPVPIANSYNEDVEDETFLAPVHPPSQHIDDYPVHGSTSQQFPLPAGGDEEGGTPGRPGIDYPTLTVIPQTSFDCKTQRYKGFFADTETRCQVWHYCDLNGGQASFLCPNGTIFSQAGLTCDWWFNVRCDSATQLYVLNESLYKFILPHRPKFPEDYSGPLVDKYLTLKFKEMEEQFKKNKNKQTASEKMDADEDENSKETVAEDSDSSKNVDEADDKITTVNTASVIVESPGTSGNVERLHE